MSGTRRGSRRVFTAPLSPCKGRPTSTQVMRFTKFKARIDDLFERHKSGQTMWQQRGYRTRRRSRTVRILFVKSRYPRSTINTAITLTDLYPELVRIIPAHL